MWRAFASISDNQLRIDRAHPERQRNDPRQLQSQNAMDARIRRRKRQLRQIVAEHLERCYKLGVRSKLERRSKSFPCTNGQCTNGQCPNGQLSEWTLSERPAVRTATVRTDRYPPPGEWPKNLWSSANGGFSEGFFPKNFSARSTDGEPAK